MLSLRKDLRSQLEKTVLKARALAEQGASEALTTLGGDQAKPFDHLTTDLKKLRNQLRARGRHLGDTLDASGRQTHSHLVATVGYEHWHRMLFARFLAENGLLLEPEHQVPVSLADVDELARDAKMDNWELAGRFAQRMLPAVFRADDPVLALPLARETRTQLERLVADLPREVFLADDSLGWTYQFWQAQRKADVNKSGVKIGADELSPVTQLFTEDYMVEFLLHNTLGAWWAGKLGPINAANEGEARAKASLGARDGLGVDWTYLRFVQDHKTNTWTPAAGTFKDWPTAAKNVTFLDPCMGSGHFAVFALPLIARLRMEEEGLNNTEGVAATLRDNIYGLELDERCTQIAAFNLALAAWKLGGYQTLPLLHFACSGLAPNASEKEWVAIARKDAKAQNGMARLYRLFRNAPVLGSLINPRAAGDELLEGPVHELQPLLEKALTQETRDDVAHEMAVAASGLAKAAEILAGQFTLVATNVPYLGRGKQDKVLQDYCERFYPLSKADLATCFVERCLEFCSAKGTTSLVTPQNWLSLKTYRDLRVLTLEHYQWDIVARLGAKGFQTPMWDFNVQLGVISASEPRDSHLLAGIDAQLAKQPSAKANQLQGGCIWQGKQEAQLKNPDARITFDSSTGHSRLQEFASTWQGFVTGDTKRFTLAFWEVADRGTTWEWFVCAPERTADFVGRSFILRWDQAKGALHNESTAHNFPPPTALGKKGILLSQFGTVRATQFLGEFFNDLSVPLIPNKPDDLAALTALCTDTGFNESVRTQTQSLQVRVGYFLGITFDLAHWQKVAAEKYPDGLPKPFSSDPTQWLFIGHPAGADQPLQVAVARLVGYRWPRQTGSSFTDCPALKADGLEKHADEDGVVCLSPVRGEGAGAECLRALLSAALGKYDEHRLINATESKAKSLEIWLRDEFFEQHCALFHDRPFIWHVWDGLSDGFQALINYHKLAAPGGAGHKLLETLTYSYLGEWIRTQQDGMKRNQAGSEDRLIAAQALQKELEAILAGEPPYDLFVRWKPLKQQAIGWEPEINDGVRMNIRPFLLANDVGRKGAGILRAKPNIKWDKDRGTEPERDKADFPWFWGWNEEAEDFAGTGKEPDGSRWNECHYTTRAKRDARERHKLTK